MKDIPNFFDVATPEEILEFFEADTLDDPEIIRRRKMSLENVDYNLELLAYLYAGRKNFSESEKWLEQISDGSLKADTARMIAHDADYLDWQMAHCD